MIGNYKIIALCTCRIQDKECHEFVSSLSSRLSDMGWRLFVYNCCSRITDNNPFDNVQTSVYKLINPSFIDAVILHGDRFESQTLCEAIADHVREMELPVITIGASCKGCLNMEYNHYVGFAETVEHLIDVHGITDIHMIAGVKGNPYSDERITAFKNVLQSHNIPFDSSMVSYGDFWSGPAEAAVERLASQGKLPRAFVCANDLMAIAVTTLLHKKGISVPETVAVTGYDRIDTVFSSEPTVTTAYINSDTVINKIIDALSEAFNGGSCCGNTEILSELVINKSCGCNSSKKLNSAYFFNEQHNNFFRFQDENILLAEVGAKIQQCADFDEIAFTMKEKDLMYAMCCMLKPECIDKAISPDEKLSDDFGDNLFLLYDSDLIDYEKINGRNFSPHFVPASEIIPALNYYLDDKRCLIFTSLYYLNTLLGYVCFHFSEYEEGNYFKIPQTVNMINNAIGGLRSLRHKNFLMSRIDEMSKTDVLTGLNNRRGFCLEYSSLTKKYGADSLTVVMCDLDGLKKINDNFGHEEGDRAITTVAQALKHACPDGAALTRFGGDEMMAVYYEPITDDEMRSKFEKYLSEYNEKSGKAYTVAASIGIYHTRCGELLSFEELIKKSDSLMYSEKKRRKAMREQ